MSVPLTPALSRRERENCCQSVDESEMLVNLRDVLCCSLSWG